MDENKFKEKLLELCDEYDAEAGEYPDSQYQGRSIYEYYLRKYHPDVAEEEITQYYKEQEEFEEKAAESWFEGMADSQRDELIRDGLITESFLEKYNKKHGTHYEYRKWKNEY
jgi:hypothetical protein